MWGGLVCDICKRRIPIVRMEADIEIPVLKDGKRSVQVLAAEFDSCEVCLTSKDIRVLKVRHQKTYEEPTVGK